MSVASASVASAVTPTAVPLAALSDTWCCPNRRCPLTAPTEASDVSSVRLTGKALHRGRTVSRCRGHLDRMGGRRLIVEQRVVRDHDDAACCYRWRKRPPASSDKAVAHRVRRIRIGGQCGDPDRRAVGCTLRERCWRRTIVVRDRARPQASEVSSVKLIGEALDRGRTVAARSRRDLDRVAGRSFVVQQGGCRRR